MKLLSSSFHFVLIKIAPYQDESKRKNEKSDYLLLWSRINPKLKGRHHQPYTLGSASRVTTTAFTFSLSLVVTRVGNTAGALILRQQIFRFGMLRIGQFDLLSYMMGPPLIYRKEQESHENIKSGTNFISRSFTTTIG